MPVLTATMFADFLAASPSSYHAAKNVRDYLVNQGFREQREAEPWDATPGGHVVCRDGAIIAYRLPAQITKNTAFRIVGAHTDSPGFKLKPHPNHECVGFSQAGMEIYGAPLRNSWLDREFGLAGRVISRETGETALVATSAWLRIPQLAPHLDHTVHENLHLDPQIHLMPVYAMADTGADLMAAIAALVGFAPDAHDLFSYIPQRPETFGVRNEFLAGGRMDNLSSVYPAMVAMGEIEPGEDVVPIIACFDHEEIGSATRSGAAGPFLETVLRRIQLGMGITGDEAFQMMARSWVVSSDAGHSVHPNYPSMHDPDERPLLGRGPMLKVNARQRYTTDAPGEAMWLRACDQAGMPSQWFVSNNSVSCGSTIGPITATRLGIPTVDVGIPLLSMHSAREMCCPADVEALRQVLRVFLSDL